MTRNYLRKTNRQSWDPVKMAKAIESVKNGTPLLTAAKDYSIARNSLRRRVKLYEANYGNMELTCQKGLGRFDTVFSPLQEAEFVAFLKKQEELLHGLTPKEFRILAWQMAEKNGLVHNFRDGMAGRDWLRLFLKRNSTLSTRKPEGVSSNRAMAFNKIVVQNFFTLLSEQLQKYNFSPDRIFNVDETGATVIPKTLSRIIATKGKRQVGKKTSGERGKIVTAMLCVSASGHALPPVHLFPRKRMNPKLMEGAQDGAWGMATESGWSTMETFFEWFKWFVKVVKPTEDKPVLLLLDGHSSHVKNVPVIKYARAHNTVIICFPPHCTHRLQPLDVSVMKPISVYYSDEVSAKERRDAGRNTQQGDIPFLFGRAYSKATTPSVIMNGFRVTGIHPFNSEIFTDADFAPSEVTNRPAPQAQSSRESLETDFPEGEPTNDPTELNNSPRQVLSPFSYPSNDSDSDSDVQMLEEVECDPHSPLNRKDRRARNTRRLNINNDSNSDAISEESELPQVQPIPVNSKYCRLHERKSQGFTVKPHEIMPIPSANDDPTRKRRPRGRTAVITDNEYLGELEEAKRTAEEKRTNKSARKRQKSMKTSKSRTSQRKSAPERGDIALEIEREKEDEKSDEEDDEMCKVCSKFYSESNELSIQCDRCDVWAHIKCVGVSEEQCEDDYTCTSCNNSKRRRSTTSSAWSSKTSQSIRKISQPEREGVSDEPERADDMDILQVDEEDDIPCMFCKQMHHGQWIQCDSCDGWAHVQCAGVSVKNIAKDYICKICRRAKKEFR